MSLRHSLHGLVLVVGLAAGCIEPVDELCSSSAMRTMWIDADQDGHGDPGTAQLLCPSQADGFTNNDDDCDDTRAGVNPSRTEDCDGIDNDCDGAIDEQLRLLAFFQDGDGDGFGNPDVVTERCAPPAGYVENPYDCDDTNSATYPQATEFCDGEDNDCDGLIDDADPSLDKDTTPTWWADADGDGFGDPEVYVERCEPPTANPTYGITVQNDDDCNDQEPLIHPDADENCNGYDDDCDGRIDDSDDNLDPAELSTFYYDGDLDGHGDANQTIQACEVPWFYSALDDDCDDNEPLLADESTGFWTPDVDGDGYGLSGPVSGPSCDPPGADYALAQRGVDCDDTEPATNPGAQEVCNGFDDDCDRLVDDADPDVDANSLATWYIDGDGDGWGDGADSIDACVPPSNGTFVVQAGDCNDDAPGINPDATEVCGGGDEDCDGLEDDADPDVDLNTRSTWYYDGDDDGFGDFGSTIEACGQPTSYVDNGGDCDDTSDQVGNETTWYPDLDGDGHGAGTPDPTIGCYAPGPDLAPLWAEIDCDDDDPLRSPSTPEVCGDGFDQDCDLADLECPPGASCQALLDLDPTTPTGVYELEPNGTDGLVQVFCDMDVDGGGWTLVASSSSPIDDRRMDYARTLTTLAPVNPTDGLWGGMREIITANSDIRFACKEFSSDSDMTVDLSFYDVGWYDELTSSTQDGEVCFNEANGSGYDGAPERRDNQSGDTRAAGDDWDWSGYLEGEDACNDTQDFTVDFDDRGMDGDNSDGTDWGEDGGVSKCGVAGAGEAWFVFVRELPTTP
jgi:hypothetical protein